MSDKELLAYVRSFRRGILQGRKPDRMCAMICEPLASLLDICGVHTEVVTVDFPTTDHVFLKLADGRILDPTASQFNQRGVRFPVVYLGPLPDLFMLWMAQADAEDAA